MNGNLNSYSTETDEYNVNPENSDYKDLIKKLKEIKLIIALLEKIIFK